MVGAKFSVNNKRDVFLKEASFEDTRDAEGRSEVTLRHYRHTEWLQANPSAWDVSQDLLVIARHGEVL